MAAVSVAGPLLAGCSSPDSSNGNDDSQSGGDSDEIPSFGGWFSNTGNYDGVVDKTGASSVTVKVGAKGNMGHYAFEPPAIKVAAGTTVTWEWTGKGATHNVVAKDGSFESEYASEKGHTFEHTFSESGTFKYFCRPHKTMGMKGVVVVE